MDERQIQELIQCPSACGAPCQSRGLGFRVFASERLGCRVNPKPYKLQTLESLRIV